MDLAKQVYPGETTAESVQRCREGLHPRLKLAVGELTKPTAEHLIHRCQQAVRDLNNLERVEQRQGKQPIPPMHPYAKERENHRQFPPQGQRQYPPQKQRHYPSQGDRKPNDRFNPRSNFRNVNFSRRGASGYQQPQRDMGYQQQQRRDQPPQEKTQDVQTAYANKRDFRRETRVTYGRPRQQPSTSNNPQYADKECYTCKKPGHIAKFCPATAFFFHGNEEEEDESVGRAKAVGNLNEEGGQ